MIKKYFVFLITFFSIFTSLSAAPFNYYAQRAEELLNEGKYLDAYDYAHQEIIDYPDNPNGYYMASQALFILNQRGEAISMIDKAIDKAKKDKKLLPGYYQIKADLYENAGDTVQALQALNSGLKIDSKNIDLLIQRGSLLMTSDPKASLADLNKVEKLDPNRANIYILKALVYFDMEKGEEALNQIDKAIALNPRDYLGYSYAVRAAIKKNLLNSPDWLNDAIISIKYDGNKGYGVNVLADCKTEEEKLEVLKALEEIVNEVPEAITLQADLVYNWGNFLVAAKGYETIIEKEMADESTYYKLADCQYRLNFKLDAYDTATKGLILNPDATDLKFVKAKIGVEVGKAQESIPILQEMSELNHEDPEIYALLGDAYLSLADYKKAGEFYSIAIAIYPLVKFRLTYADILRLQGQKEKANRIYEEIINTPESVYLQEGLIPDVIYAYAQAGLGNLSGALGFVDKLQTDYGSDKLWIDSIKADIYAITGHNAEAIEILKKCLDYPGSEGNLIYFLSHHSLFPLHVYPEFQQLFIDRDLDVALNPQTNTLAIVLPSLDFSSGGTPLSEIINLLATSPEETVREVNRLCPIDLGVSGQLIRMEFDKDSNTVSYYYDVSGNDFYNHLLTNKNDKEYIRRKVDLIMLQMLDNFPIITASNMNIRYYYVFKTNEHVKIDLTAKRFKELTKMYNNQDEIDWLIINDMIDSDNRAYQLKEATKNNYERIEDGFLSIYTPVKDENNFYSSMEIFRNDAKNNISLFFSDPIFLGKLPPLVRQKIGIKLVYFDPESSREVDIVFSPEEIAEIMERSPY